MKLAYPQAGIGGRRLALQCRRSEGMIHSSVSLYHKWWIFWWNGWWVWTVLHGGFGLKYAKADVGTHS
jgi:hypothetical protein